MRGPPIPASNVSIVSENPSKSFDPSCSSKSAAPPLPDALIDDSRDSSTLPAIATPPGPSNDRAANADNAKAQCVRCFISTSLSAVRRWRVEWPYTQHMRRTLDGMVVVITGASAGIGAALAEALHARGARMALAARRL